GHAAQTQHDSKGALGAPPSRPKSLPPDHTVRLGPGAVSFSLLVWDLVRPPVERLRSGSVLRGPGQAPARAACSGANRRAPLAPSGCLAVVSPSGRAGIQFQP